MKISIKIVGIGCMQEEKGWVQIKQAEKFLNEIVRLFKTF